MGERAHTHSPASLPPSAAEDRLRASDSVDRHLQGPGGSDIYRRFGRLTPVDEWRRRVRFDVCDARAHSTAAPKLMYQPSAVPPGRFACGRRRSTESIALTCTHTLSIDINITGFRTQHIRTYARMQPSIHSSGRTRRGRRRQTFAMSTHTHTHTRTIALQR